MSARLPDPSLTRVYRLEATLGEPLDLGDLAQGRRRIVPLTGGTFAGPELNGKLLPGSSADRQTILPTEPPSATSATRSRPTRAICSMSNHAACATASAAPGAYRTASYIRLRTPKKQPSRSVHIGGYRSSSGEERKLQCVTRKRWLYTPDRRLGASGSLIAAVHASAPITQFGAAYLAAD
jgi:hypothetical protein